MEYYRWTFSPSRFLASTVINRPLINEEGKPTFAQRSLKLKKQDLAVIVAAGESYGQGSSREHAALCPMYLGVRAVIAKSIERIHKANLINFAIVPIEFDDPADYDRLSEGSRLFIEDLPDAVRLRDEVEIQIDGGPAFKGRLTLSQRDRQILLAAGLLNYAKKKAMPQ